MAKDLEEILKYASQDVLDINPDLFQNDQKVGGEKKSELQKYRNRKTKLNGITFDSKAEAKYYSQLLSLESKGLIRDLECQPRYTLLDSFVNSLGKKVRRITYSADFKYFDVQQQKWYIVDVKSPPTSKNQLFRCKWKMMQYLFKDDPDTVLELVVT